MSTLTKISAQLSNIEAVLNGLVATKPVKPVKQVKPVKKDSKPVKKDGKKVADKVTDKIADCLSSSKLSKFKVKELLDYCATNHIKLKKSTKADVIKAIIKFNETEYYTTDSSDSDCSSDCSSDSSSDSSDSDSSSDSD